MSYPTIYLDDYDDAPDPGPSWAGSKLRNALRRRSEPLCEAVSGDCAYIATRFCRGCNAKLCAGCAGGPCEDGNAHDSRDLQVAIATKLTA